MFAIDTNILVYAHNKASKLNKSAVSFVEKFMNDRNEHGGFLICIPVQVLQEFIHVITWQRLESPLPINDAVKIVNDYLECNVPIIYQKTTQVDTFLKLLTLSKSRKNIYDLALTATLIDNNIKGLYTVNINDFKQTNLIEVINPL